MNPEADSPIDQLAAGIQRLDAMHHAVDKQIARLDDTLQDVDSALDDLDALT